MTELPQETGIDEIYVNHLEVKGWPQDWDAAKQSLLRLIEEKVIGKDEEIEITEETWREFQKTAPHPFNELKAEQRSKLRELLGGAKNE